MKKILGVLCCGFFVLGMACLSLAHEPAEKIVVAGTGDSQDILRILADAFEQTHLDVGVEVPESIGSGGGIRVTAEGLCALGRVARPIKQKEKKYNLNYKVFGHSPIVFAVNANVTKIKSLTPRQIVDIYSGKITDWEQVGGETGKIYVANREDGDSSRIVLEKKLSGFKDIEQFAGQVIFNTPETAKTIATYRNTIGYLPLAMAEQEGMVVLNLDGVAPSAKNVLKGRYPLSVPLGLVWKGDLDGPAKDFFDFLFSPEAKTLMKNNGVVSVTMEKE